MRGLWREVNEFFSSTSIHGFSYISDSQSKSTRFIWILIVLFGFFFTSYFLYETIDGFDEKYVITTVEEKSIKHYPSPAVTFHPSSYNSKEAFLRNFLNEFEFTRYDKNNSLRDNDQFLKSYIWLLGSLHNKLFEITMSQQNWKPKGSQQLQCNAIYLFE